MITPPPYFLTPAMIAYEDDYLLIVDKPAGMLTHPTVNEAGATLCDLVRHYYAQISVPAKIHPVSRLDRNTSGLVIFAKDPVVQYWLSLQPIQKEYYAVTCGTLPAAAGVIEAPIARKEGSIIERCVDFHKGKYAKTLYEFHGKFRDKTLVKLTLCTGRTHQLRVHMAYIGCPLCNDNLYGGDSGPRSRHALHAWGLLFRHPVSDNMLEITRKLPKDLTKILYSDSL